MDVILTHNTYLSIIASHTQHFMEIVFLDWSKELGKKSRNGLSTTARLRC